jgi:hypothetical protein
MTGTGSKNKLWLGLGRHTSWLMCYWKIQIIASTGSESKLLCTDGCGWTYQLRNWILNYKGLLSFENMASAFHPITYEDSVYMVCYGYLGLKRAISNLGKSQGYRRPAARAAPDAKRITIIKSSSLFTQHVIFFFLILLCKLSLGGSKRAIICTGCLFRYTYKSAR